MNYINIITATNTLSTKDAYVIYVEHLYVSLKNSQPIPDNSIQDQWKIPIYKILDAPKVSDKSR